jgi:hypothetical protein
VLSYKQATSATGSGDDAKHSVQVELFAEYYGYDEMICGDGCTYCVRLYSLQQPISNSHSEMRGRGNCHPNMKGRVLVGCSLVLIAQGSAKFI